MPKGNRGHKTGSGRRHFICRICDKRIVGPHRDANIKYKRHMRVVHKRDNVVIPPSPHVHVNVLGSLYVNATINQRQ